jgi:hypothetical protein
MAEIKTLLKAPVYRLLDFLASSEYAREKLWQVGRDLFVQAPPASVDRVRLAPMPAQYRSPGTPRAVAPDTRSESGPIFITARFRSGSTFLWQLFKSIDGITCHYEPLNEAEWMTKGSDDAHVDATHIGVDDYRAEYEGMEDLAEHFEKGWAFHYLYMDETHHNPKLELYLSELVARAQGRAVLQFNRVDFRLPWLRAHFPDARILHLYRHPREQWMSIVGKSARIAPDATIEPGRITSVDGFYTLEWARDLRHVFPFLEPAGKHPYELHYLLWRLSHSFGLAYSDASVCYEDLVDDFEHVASSMLQGLGVHHADIAQLAKLNHGKQKTRWPEYANEAWFSEREAKCDSELETFFSCITPLRTA